MKGRWQHEVYLGDSVKNHNLECERLRLGVSHISYAPEIPDCKYRSVYIVQKMMLGGEASDVAIWAIFVSETHICCL